MAKLFRRAIPVAALCAAVLTWCIMPGTRMPSDTAPQAQFLKVASRRSVYPSGDTFTPATDLSVLRSTAAGTWQTVPLSDWTSVTVTPEGKPPTDASDGYRFTCLGNHTVAVEALGIKETYDLWAAEERPAMDITYIDGVAGTMKQNAGGEWEVTTVNEQTGYPGRTYYMGREDTVPVKLNVDSTGVPYFRPDRVNNDFIPVGTVAEMRLINTPGALGDRYYLEADLDLLGAVTAPLAKYQWEPIGKPDPFTGEFDGKNKSFYNIYANKLYGVGLFGYLNDDAVLQNIRLESGSVTGSTDTGGIAGAGKTTPRLSKSSTVPTRPM